jgi:hypothetical protein
VPENIPWEVDNEESVPTASDSGGAYSGYTQDHTYNYDPGVVAAPLASALPQVRLIRLHGGFQTRKVDWTASRNGKPPVIPAAVDTVYDKLVGAVAVVGLPVPNRDAAGYNWNLSGSYLYVGAAPRIPGVHALPTGSHPYPVEPQNSLAQERAANMSSEIEAAAEAIANAAEDDTPKSITDAVSALLATDNQLGVDQPWPFTFFDPIFSTDLGVDA